ncbi:TetR/AcrR family transcriptional regulator [Ottowia sp.]|uniref:TetR/AcrR family transcriptional regulator n=1 Tax=Ottowia sp. TaxID=1898956 RepID=UPI0035338A2B
MSPIATHSSPPARASADTAWSELDDAELPSRLAAPPRQRRGRERQRALIKAGLHLTARRNWADVTIADIAAAIGCSIGTFYTRFHTKDAYFDALLELVVEAMLRYTAEFHAAPERRTESAPQFVAQWVHLAVHSFRQHRGLYAAAVLDQRRMSDEARATSPLTRLRERSRELLLAAMARRAGWRSRAARARLVAAHQMLQGVLINAVLTDPGPLFLDDPALETELVRMLRAYLGLNAVASASAPAAASHAPRKQVISPKGDEP